MSLIELGLVTFADLDRVDSARARLRHVIDEAVVAEDVGLDVFGVGEHHRPDYAISAPAVVLSAIAERTEKLLLTSAVTVLGSDDPVRVYQAFATLDLLSDGRAEIIAGRGAFHESFPLFGFDLEDYDELYAERLDLLLAIRDAEVVTWAGTHRTSIENRGVYPRSVRSIPIWMAAGSSAASVERAGTLGLPLALAIIGGNPKEATALIDRYRTVGGMARHDPGCLRVAVNYHMYVAESSQRAREEFFPFYRAKMSRINRERGRPAMTRADFDDMCSHEGALLIGSPDDVVEKLLRQHRSLRFDRVLSNTSVGVVDHAKVLKSIALFGKEVAPVIRAEAACAPMGSLHATS
jgi:probable LLM family oxidoreductase